MAYTVRNSRVYGIRTLDTTLARRGEFERDKPAKIYTLGKAHEAIRDNAKVLSTIPVTRCEGCRHEGHWGGPRCPECA